MKPYLREVVCNKYTDVVCDWRDYILLLLLSWQMHSKDLCGTGFKIFTVLCVRVGVTIYEYMDPSIR